MNGLILAKTIIVYIYPVISLIGIITNVLSFIVFSRKIFYNTIFSTYFRFSIIFDSIALLFPINKLFELNFNIYFSDFNNELCKFRYYFIYFTFPISGWILVVVSVDRFLNISFPNRFLFTKKAKFQFFMCLFVLGFNLVYYIPNLFFHIKVNVKWNNSTNQSKTTLKCTNPGVPIEWMNMLLTSILPFIFMFFFTSLTVFLLFKSRNRISTNNSNQVIRQKDKIFAKTSITLNLIFFLINLPVRILSITKFYHQNLFNNDNLYQLISSLSYLIAYTNSATVFFTNISVNSIFRNEFMKWNFSNRKINNINNVSKTMNGNTKRI
jgi:hypothetical protein